MGIVGDIPHSQTHSCCSCVPIFTLLGSPKSAHKEQSGGGGRQLPSANHTWHMKFTYSYSNVVKTIINHPVNWEWQPHTTYFNDDRGMVQMALFETTPYDDLSFKAPFRPRGFPRAMFDGCPVQFHCGVVPAVMNVPTLVVTGEKNRSLNGELTLWQISRTRETADFPLYNLHLQGISERLKVYNRVPFHHSDLEMKSLFY